MVQVLEFVPLAQPAKPANMKSLHAQQQAIPNVQLVLSVDTELIKSHLVVGRRTLDAPRARRARLASSESQLARRLRTRCANRAPLAAVELSKLHHARQLQIGLAKLCLQLVRKGNTCIQLCINASLARSALVAITR